MSAGTGTHECRRFAGKVVVITGSTAGIGLAIAERVGLEGARVVVSSRKQSGVDEAVNMLQGRGIECVGITCNVGNASQREALIELAVQKYGRIDALVSNAVVNPTSGPLLDTPEPAIDKILQVNVKAAVLLASAAVPHMPPLSSILFVSSVVAYAPGPPLSMYGVSKTALLGLTKALAAELGPEKGIRVNGIAPGIVPTKFAEALVQTEALRDAQVAATALGRLGTPGDIAGAAAFLLSPDAAYVTGETLVVAGGMRSKL